MKKAAEPRAVTAASLHQTTWEEERLLDAENTGGCLVRIGRRISVERSKFTRLFRDRLFLVRNARGNVAVLILDLGHFEKRFAGRRIALLRRIFTICAVDRGIERFGGTTDDADGLADFKLVEIILRLGTALALDFRNCNVRTNCKDLDTFVSRSRCTRCRSGICSGLRSAGSVTSSGEQRGRSGNESSLTHGLPFSVGCVMQ